ncbi:hypothetical protein EDF46_2379 [Frondihabitans sp. PhB188]|uniref:hypothetical protein n=1 Tax=Frondihabitans sp. PhB188 TaxID=2485200 RepID=UPI000F4AD8EC|nr:hypothetical protein [Frondihabitans sp. PhB188]ROQ38738.1 hypothetical protein EDF46_2379 [Frondihabitans sp. PhB188]
MRFSCPLLISAAACVLLLAGCSAEPALDQAALDKWTAQQEAVAQGGGSLGALSAGITTQDPEPGTDEGITITYATPTDIGGFDFSCFGSGTMSGTLTTVAGSLSTNKVYSSLSCAEGLQRLYLSRAGRTQVEKVTFNAFDANQDSAWQVVIR